MITKEKIERRISELELMQTQLRMQNDRMVAERNEREQAFQEGVLLNQKNFQQIIGAIAQLKELLNGEKPPEKIQ